LRWHAAPAAAASPRGLLHTRQRALREGLRRIQERRAMRFARVTNGIGAPFAAVAAWQP